MLQSRDLEREITSDVTSMRKAIASGEILLVNRDVAMEMVYYSVQ